MEDINWRLWIFLAVLLLINVAAFWIWLPLGIIALIGDAILFVLFLYAYAQAWSH